MSTTPEETYTETLLVSSQTLFAICQSLTGYGAIVGLTAEGEIKWELSGADAFEVGRTAADVEKELNTYDTGVLIQRNKR